jgi:hypothetical protein
MTFHKPITIFYNASDFRLTGIRRLSIVTVKQLPIIGNLESDNINSNRDWNPQASHREINTNKEAGEEMGVVLKTVRNLAIKHKHESALRR